MPAETSYLFLEVGNVRAERLHSDLWRRESKSEGPVKAGLKRLARVLGREVGNEQANSMKLHTNVMNQVAMASRGL